MTRGLLAAGALACAALAPGAVADQITIETDQTVSVQGTGAEFTATFNWNATGGTGMGLLTVMVQNLTDASLGGTMTALAFHDAGLDLDLVEEPTGHNFTQLTGGIATPPPGVNLGGIGDFGVAIAFDATDMHDPEANANEWMAAGNGNTRGLQDGATAVFEFVVTGGSTAGISASDFVALNDHGAGMIMRFKGVNGQSDELILVPLPPAAWMGVAGLLGAGVLRRRFR